MQHIDMRRESTRDCQRCVERCRVGRIAGSRDENRLLSYRPLCLLVRIPARCLRAGGSVAAAILGEALEYALSWINATTIAIGQSPRSRRETAGTMEIAMANTPIEVKKAAPAPAHDAWRSFRSEMDRLFIVFRALLPSPHCVTCSMPIRCSARRVRSLCRRSSMLPRTRRHTGSPPSCQVSNEIHRAFGLRRQARPARREARGKGAEGQELLHERAGLRLVPACLCAARGN